MAIMIPDPDATKKAKAIFLGADFGRAFCQHFGLPAGQVLTVSPHADRDEIMHAKVEIALTADDLAGIAAIMGGAKPPKAPSLDRLPVVSMDMASGPDMTAVAEIVKDAHGKQYITVVNNLTTSLGDPNSRLSRVMKAGVAREFVRIAGGKSYSDQGEGLGAKPAGEDPMEATRALVKKHGGGSGG